MQWKKILAVVLSAAMLLCALPFAASAAGTPSALYVGEERKNGDNLIAKYQSEGTVTVYSVKDAQNFYRVTYEDGVGYVLTFYNEYAMSAVVEKGKTCGLYCDGDLTVRLDITPAFAKENPAKNVDITFDLTQKYFDIDLNAYTETVGAYGWYVDGTLTIECINAKSMTNAAQLTVTGDLAQSDDANTGIYAKTLLLNHVTVHANGGNVGVDGGQAIGMIGAALYANTADSLQKGDARLFNYSIRTENLIEVNSKVTAPGALDVDAFYGDNADNSGIEEDPVVYARAYEFKEDTFKGNWNTSFDLFRNPSLIPACLRIINPAGTATRPITGKSYRFDWLSIRGSRATFRRPTPGSGVQLSLVLVCGHASYTMDVCTAIGTVQWWQTLAYFFSGNWLN